MQQKLLTKCLSSFLLFCLINTQAMALNLDLSVDDEIRKNYNPSKLEEEKLPPLPNLQPAKPAQPTQSKLPAQSTQPKQPTQAQKPVSVQLPKVDGNYAKLKKGTKFKVKLATNISDKNTRGARLTLISEKPVTTTYLTVPTKTVFKGEIVDSHPPQMTGNGGLIVIKVNSMVLNGSTHTIDASITKANHSMVFLNNIKGDRRYMENMYKTTKPSRKYWGKMCKTAGNLADDGGTLILSPFPIAIGAMTVGVNFIASPVLAVFSKGGNISIPAGSEFEIKLLDDVIIYN